MILNAEKQALIDAFHDLYYDEKNRSPILNSTRWMGIPIIKCPLDLWIYQEIMFELKPRLIIETGTWHGGSALWFAQMLDLIHQGGYGHQVVSIDIKKIVDLPTYPHLAFLQGSSLNHDILNQVANLVIDITHWGSKDYPRDHCMVVLDSDHSAKHVFQELEAYSRYVTPGSYLIVEDTDIGNPVLKGWGKGPMEAVQSWLPNHPEFEVDKSREKFLMTMNPGGFLRKIK